MWQLAGRRIGGQLAGRRSCGKHGHANARKCVAESRKNWLDAESKIASEARRKQDGLRKPRRGVVRDDDDLSDLTDGARIWIALRHALHVVLVVRRSAMPLVLKHQAFRASTCGVQLAIPSCGGRGDGTGKPDKAKTNQAKPSHVKPGQNTPSQIKPSQINQGIPSQAVCKQYARLVILNTSFENEHDDTKGGRVSAISCE